MEAETRNPAQPFPVVSWEMLEKSLAHPNALIREKAIETASRCPEPKSVPALQRAISDEDARVRAAALQALILLAKSGIPQAESIVAELMITPGNEELRAQAIPASVASGRETLLSAAIQCLVEPSETIRSAARAALELHDPAWMISPTAHQIAPRIEAARQSDSPEVREAAAHLSETLRRAHVRRTMLENGLASSLTLTNALRAGSVVIREAAAWALQATGDRRGIPALVEALHDPAESVRHAAAVGLAEMKWPAASEADHAAHLVALQRWEAVVQLGAAAVDAVILCARQSHPATQVRAIQSLMELKDVRALMPLQELMAARDSSVRHAAARALKALNWTPPTEAHAVTLAMELEDWTTVATMGRAAVQPLVAALKAAHGDRARQDPIRQAICLIRDDGAAPALTACCRDGEVAATCAQALASLLEHRAADVATDALVEISNLQSLVQFQFTIDPQHRRPVRSGLEFVNTDQLRSRAEAELAQRTPTPAGAATP